MIRHCPRCELRFVSDGELREHLEVDHGVEVQPLERYRYPAREHVEPPLYDDMREQPPADSSGSGRTGTGPTHRA